MERGFRHISLLAVILHSSLSLSAQDYLKGKIESGGQSQEVYYDRTQNFITKNVYQSVYKVFDKKKTLLYSVTLTHDRVKLIVFLSVKKQEGSDAKATTVKYERNNSGLIFSDKNNVDTAFSITQSYDYLFSFTDTTRDYPILHKVVTGDGREILLDPLSKLRLKKHGELIRKMLLTNPLLLKGIGNANGSPTFNQRLIQMFDSLYAQKTYYESMVDRINNEINQHITELFVTKKVYADAKRYEGQKKNREADGKGLFMSNGSYYDGDFSNGKFVSGNVRILTEAYEYCGNYSQDSMNGIGKFKYPNGSYLIGSFVNGAPQNAILFSNDKNGEKYFGRFANGERTGYGEFQNAKGGVFCGEFLKGKIIRGYSKEVDPFGFFTYSKIENGIKSAADKQQALDFFNHIEGKNK